MKRKGGPSSCPLCKEQLSDRLYQCPDCKVTYHDNCAEEMGGCATLGCKLKGKMVAEPGRAGSERHSTLRSLQKVSPKWHKLLRRLQVSAGYERLYTNLVNHFRRHLLWGTDPLPSPEIDNIRNPNAKCRCSLCNLT